MRKFLLSSLALTLVFCSDKKPETVVAPEEKTGGKEFQMYEMTEMALLMEQMYVDNQRLKERIASGDTIGSMPKHYDKIHSAAMTDPEENDEFFKAKADEFLKAQNLIYSDPENAKTHFNAGVDACIACHKVKCAGPVSRIKKLYLK